MPASIPPQDGTGRSAIAPSAGSHLVRRQSLKMSSSLGWRNPMAIRAGSGQRIHHEIPCISRHRDIPGAAHVRHGARHGDGWSPNRLGEHHSCHTGAASGGHAARLRHPRRLVNSGQSRRGRGVPERQYVSGHRPALGHRLLLPSRHEDCCAPRPGGCGDSDRSAARQRRAIGEPQPRWPVDAAPGLGDLQSSCST
jgi:hypothetical protein